MSKQTLKFDNIVINKNIFMVLNKQLLYIFVEYLELLNILLAIYMIMM